MNKKHLPLLPILVMIIMQSCSVSKKINNEASRNIYEKKAFAVAHVGISIFNPATGKYVYQHEANKNFVPASNTKIITCYVAMKHLGDSIESIKYRIINDSTVRIRPLGDPTFLHPDYHTHPVFNFLRGYQNIEIEKPSFTRYLGNGWSWNDYTEDYMAQRSAMPVYGNVLTVKRSADSLSLSPRYFKRFAAITTPGSGFTVRKKWDTNDFVFSEGRQHSAVIPFIPDIETVKGLLEDTLLSKISVVPASGTLNQSIYSHALDTMLTAMMHRSDNFFAEQSLLMVSNRVTGELDEKKGIDTLLKSDLRFLPQKPKWADGSGLSRYNNFSPNDFVQVLDNMRTEFGMERLKTIFATGGIGTLKSYYQEEKGKIFAKTGSLNGVIALSGFIYTHKNELLIFSILVNEHNAAASEIREGIEDFIQQIMKKY